MPARLTLTKDPFVPFASLRPGTSRSTYLAAVPPLLALAFALGLWLTLEPARVKELVAEGGPIEHPTALLYFALAGLLWLGRQAEDSLLEWVALTVVFVAFGARELDLHRAWTNGSMLKISFYTREAPLLHKFCAAAVVAVVAAAMVFVVRRFARRAWAGLARREPLACTVAIFVVTLLVSKVLDRSVNILSGDFGVTTPLSAGALVSALEEILELSLPFVAAIGIWQHRRGMHLS